MADDLERARAGALHIDALRQRGDNTRSEAAKLALGIDLFGDGRLNDLTPCPACGTLGEPGDECGRRPEGHRHGG